jgi:hypothetical protein
MPRGRHEKDESHEIGPRLQGGVERIKGLQTADFDQ